MVTEKEAIEILRKKFPNRRIVDLFDYGDFYGSSMPSKRWDGDPWNIPSSSGIECVRKKDGEQFFYHIDDILKDHPNNTELDITKYLLNDEIAFIKKVKHLEKHMFD